MTDLRRQVISAFDALRCTLLEKRDHISICRTAKWGSPSRPPEWFQSQQSRLVDIEFASNEFAFIVAHWESYARWRATVGRDAA